MAEPLEAASSSFSQDRVAWVARTSEAPGCRRVDGCRVIVVQHAPASIAAREAWRDAALAWPEGMDHVAGDVVGDPSGDGLVAMRRHPGEMLVVGRSAPELDALMTSLAPSRASDAVAFDLTHGSVVIDLDGPRLDDWLARLVDALSMPREPGRGARVRFADVAATVLRLADDRVRLVADRAVAPYIADWLAFAHVGAFGTVTATRASITEERV